MNANPVFLALSLMVLALGVSGCSRNSPKIVTDRDRVLKINANEAFGIASGDSVLVIVANEGGKTHVRVSQGKNEALYATFGKETKAVQTKIYEGSEREITVFDENGDGIPEKRLIGHNGSFVLQIYKPGSFENAGF